ncbi:hypothetical protein KCL53_002470 [Clostridium perfringens]|uniref:hypothetical protein n=1 Tax=Clostridium perfringens TaxID=1502 RepID=UPI00103D93CC|nr:hypothetical protein [Clostridium perfringens]EHK2349319.1 hypothetical protein [Clostridium perfringens]ELC8395559.1 hypothetical protein [Clostridium perfringens]ELC8428875.1 hypothetical protein [Clostridium perfringens]TBX16942.1 hypothetical protein BFS06_01765 [Clostridium perfringens]
MGKLKALTDVIAVSGYEKNISDYILEECIKILGKSNCKQDKVGNVICKLISKTKKEKRKIVINAHIDEVGFQIYKNQNNKYYFKTLGNIKTWNAYNQFIEFENGAQGIIRATDPSKLQNFNYDNLYIDLLSGKVSIGDVCTFKNQYIENDKCIISKSIDNRISCYVLLMAMSKIVSEELVFEDDLYFTFSVQEETTMRGIRVITSTIKPDMIMNIDTTPENERSSIKLGEGLAIKVSDSIVFTDRNYTKLIIECAEKENIKYQLEVSDCGTNELIISNEEDYGAGIVGISIPCKDLHSSKTQIFKDDFIFIENLIIKFISYL